MDTRSVPLQTELLLRFGLAAGLGAVLGWDRQLGRHPAGLRTHVLVALGAAVFTIAGVYGAAGLGTVQDAGRVAAQVVVGVGFLGAGTIWRSRDDRVIHGLTTAASIWLAAGLGMLAAYGLYFLAAGGALLGVAVLRAMQPLKHAALGRPHRERPHRERPHRERPAPFGPRRRAARAAALGAGAPAEPGDLAPPGAGREDEGRRGARAVRTPRRRRGTRPAPTPAGGAVARRSGGAGPPRGRPAGPTDRSA